MLLLKTEENQRKSCKRKTSLKMLYDLYATLTPTSLIYFQNCLGSGTKAVTYRFSEK